MGNKPGGFASRMLKTFWDEVAFTLVPRPTYFDQLVILAARESISLYNIFYFLKPF